MVAASPPAGDDGGTVRILLTGGTGQLGREVAARAAARAMDVLAPPSSTLDLAAPPDALAAALRPLRFDALVHCGAFTRVDDAEADPDRAFAVNARATGVLAEECARRDVPMAVLSTDYVFDGATDRPYREDDPTGPLNVYGASKLEGERRALDAHPRGTFVIRTASLFGIAGAARAAAGRGGNFVETMIRAAARTGAVRVVDDVVMSPTAAADVATALLGLLLDGEEPGVYHLVNRGAASWSAFARAIFEDTKLEARVEPVSAAEYGAPARRPAYSVLDAGRAAAAGHRLRPWRQALRDYLAERAALSTAARGGDSSAPIDPLVFGP